MLTILQLLAPKPLGLLSLTTGFISIYSYHIHPPKPKDMQFLVTTLNTNVITMAILLSFVSLGVMAHAIIYKIKISKQIKKTNECMKRVRHIANIIINTPEAYTDIQKGEMISVFMSNLSIFEQDEKLQKILDSET